MNRKAGLNRSLKMKKSTTWRAAAMLAAALAFTCAACATTPEERGPSTNDLYKSVDSFHRHLRWARYPEASAFLEPKQREAFLGQLEELGDRYEIVEYEVKAVELQGPKRARSKVEIQWMQEADMRVYKDKINETWEVLDGRWLIVERDVIPIK